MARRFNASASSSSFEEPTVNLTPLIDVVFVILIMFIVVAPLLEFDGIKLAPSGGGINEKASVQGGSPIAILVRRDNQVVFQGTPVSFPLLKEQLGRARAQHPGARPQVFHDRQAYFETYQMVKNTLEEVGFSEMDVILQPN